MIIHFQYNKKTEDEIQTHWILFKASGVNYTKTLIDKVRNYLSENVNQRYAYVNDVSIKGCYTGKYMDNELEYEKEHDFYSLRTRSSYTYNEANKVQFVEL